MKRSGVAQLVGEAIGDCVVIASLGSGGRAWRENGGTQPTFYASDPMGAAPGLALGAALARPDLDFVLIEGDGDLTMNLGSLLAVAGAAPANLRMIVFANLRYETGGGQPLANAEKIDLAQIAVGAGWSWSRALGQGAAQDEIKQALDEWCVAPAPAILVAHVDVEKSPYGGPGELSGAEAQFVFREQIRRLSPKEEV